MKTFLRFGNIYFHLAFIVGRSCQTINDSSENSARVFAFFSLSANGNIITLQQTKIKSVSLFERNSITHSMFGIRYSLKKNIED